MIWGEKKPTLTHSNSIGVWSNPMQSAEVSSLPCRECWLMTKNTIHAPLITMVLLLACRSLLGTKLANPEVPYTCYAF